MERFVPNVISLESVGVAFSSMGIAVPRRRKPRVFLEKFAERIYVRETKTRGDLGYRAHCGKKLLFCKFDALAVVICNDAAAERFFEIPQHCELIDLKLPFEIVKRNGLVEIVVDIVLHGVAVIAFGRRDSALAELIQYQL